MAELTKGNIRHDNLLGRLPRQDIALLLPDISGAYLAELVNRLRTVVPQIEESKRWELTVSIGAAAYPENASTLDEPMQAADLALIAAQTHLRDQARYSKIRPIGPGGSSASQPEPAIDPSHAASRRPHSSVMLSDRGS